MAYLSPGARYPAATVQFTAAANCIIPRNQVIAGHPGTRLGQLPVSGRITFIELPECLTQMAKPSTAGSQTVRT